MMRLLLVVALIAVSMPQERGRSALRTSLSDSRSRNIGLLSWKIPRSNIRSDHSDYMSEDSQHMLYPDKMAEVNPVAGQRQP